MARKYFTLCLQQNDGRWTPEFGDYSKECVTDERDDMIDSSTGQFKKKDFKIITTGPRQADIVASVAELNAKEAL